MKAVQTESVRLVLEMFAFRIAFGPEMRANTQRMFEMLIDTVLTVHGFDNRLDRIREARE